MKLLSIREMALLNMCSFINYLKTKGYSMPLMSIFKVFRQKHKTTNFHIGKCRYKTYTIQGSERKQTNQNHLQGNITYYFLETIIYFCVQLTTFLHF